MLSKPKPRPLPVLFVVRELASGGIERDVTKLAKGLPRHAFTPYVATYKPEGPRHDELKNAGVPIFHIDISSLKSPRAVKAAIQFGRFVRKKKFAVVHAFDASAVFAVPLARFLRVPVVLSSMLGSRDLLDPKSRQQLRFTDRLVDTIVVNCEAMRNHLVRDYSVPAEHVELCYNGVDLAEFHPGADPKPAEIVNAPLVIGTVCVLRPEKALEVLLDAFASIRGQAPHSKLLIVGSGPELEKLQARSSALGIAGNCVFIPAVPDVARYMRAIDIFVSSSYSEAFSNSILEAMACGCCVVASKVGGTPELIADRERGLLFASGDADDLARKLTIVIEDAGLRKRLATNAAEFAKTKLNMQIAIQRTTDIYETMLRRKGVVA